MGAQKFRVYNRARESFLKPEVAVVDTTTEPLKRLIENLAIQEGTGLWLKPYRGIPSAPGLPPFDLVYLDQVRRVVQEVESYPNPDVKPFNIRTTSALVLPAHTAFASQIQTGDQLEFSVAEDATQKEPQKDNRSQPSRSEDRFEPLPQSIQKLDEKKTAFQGQGTGSLTARFLRWLKAEPSDRRAGNRHPLPDLVAYHWTGGAPKAYLIGDISHSGLFLLTEERHFPGTILLMTLQIRDSDGDQPGDSIAVRTRVIRWGADGVGFAFVVSASAGPQNGRTALENGADKKSLEEFLLQLNR
jgi:hypothetical protein